MKYLATTLAFLPALLPSLALAHGKHAETNNEATHGLLHAALSFEGFAIVAALSAVVYFIFIKK
jgi:hypothetical protein